MISEDTKKQARSTVDRTNSPMAGLVTPLKDEMPALMPTIHHIELAWFHRNLCFPSNTNMNLQRSIATMMNINASKGNIN